MTYLGATSFFLYYYTASNTNEGQPFVFFQKGGLLRKLFVFKVVRVGSKHHLSKLVIIDFMNEGSTFVGYLRYAKSVPISP